MKRALAASALLVLVSSRAVSAAPADAAGLAALSIEELMNVEVTSVSRTTKPLSATAAAVYVINAEDIRRSGARTIPDLLRGVPGLQVAQTGAHGWAVSARGFNTVFSDKLLVMIDGRSVYSQLFGGVHWDAQHVMLEDVERIEVVRGPGAALWGSNAVNGVINIITKDAADTLGGLATVAAGGEERFDGALRYGVKDGDLSYRVFAEYFDRGATHTGNDSWAAGFGGVRADWRPSESRHTFIANTYNGQADRFTTVLSTTQPFTTRLAEDETQYGSNFLYRWESPKSGESASTLQVYFDQAVRDESSIEEDRRSYDIDWQQRREIFGGHALIWGAGYRQMSDDTEGTYGTSLLPADERDHLFSLFFQDEFYIVENKLAMIVGSRFEKNDYSGFEVQPNVRLLWNVNAKQTAWASVARAVRIPTRLDHQSRLHTWTNPGVSAIRSSGDSTITSEELIAYEAGWRAQATDRLFLDAAVFFNRYDNLGVARLGGDPIFTIQDGFLIGQAMFDDQMKGQAYGAELSAQYEVTPDWRLSFSYTFVEMHLDASTDLFASERLAEGSSAENQIGVRSRMDLANNVELDAHVRYVDSLPGIPVSPYVELDCRLAWRPRRDLEIALIGHNLIEEQHLEFVSERAPGSPQIQRSLYAKLTYWF